MGSISTGLPAAVLEARKQLREGLLTLRALHDSGGSGPDVSRGLTDLVDGLVMRLYELALQQLDSNLTADEHLVLVAHGGYGRRDVAPYSDVDLMLLHTPEFEAPATTVAKYLCQWIADAGLQLGFALRTAQQCYKMAWGDATVFTTLIESRRLAGNPELFDGFFQGYRDGARRRSKRLIRAIEQARLDERRKYGETVFLLEPNVKRSRGGLRDIQFVRWVGFAQFGESDLELLSRQGRLLKEDYQAFRDGHRFLLRLRNQMHFMAAKPRISSTGAADAIGRVGWLSRAPTECCRWNNSCRSILPTPARSVTAAAHFLNRSNGIRRWPSRWSTPWPFGCSATTASAGTSGPRPGLDRLKRDPAAVLELMSISSRYNRPIEHQTWREIRAAMRSRPTGQIDEVTIGRFWELMSSTTGLASQLRRLHELRVLEQIIPEMTHARCLLQFNQYHKYTVDAHSIRAVECVTELETQPSLLGVIYRGLKNKSILHLALLIHDMGKGYPEDHSEVGRRIANRTAVRLRLSSQDQETLAFLVHQHLLLAHTAFRYDLSDHAAAVRFASVVGSSERLQLLLLLTYADLASVGPEVVNQWKIDLLLQLYYQTDAHFRDDKPGEGFRAEIASRRRAVLDAAPLGDDSQWWQEQVDALPIGYLMRSTPKELVTELSQFKLLDQQPCLAWGKYVDSLQAVEFTIATKQSGRLIGTFHRITGALSSQEMQIIAADIHTQPGNIAWDRFLVEDPQFEGCPPAARIEAVGAAIRKALDPNNPTVPTFAKKWSKFTGKAAEDLRTQPTQVRFDNSTSDNFTIITLFAYDRMGLLYDVSKVLFDMQLVLHFAKISTHLDQVVDVFYVSDLEGRKIEESTALYLIRQRLLQAVK